jgi:hypothetical protein
VTFVIDGKLVQRDSSSLRLLSAIITRFKILAGLDVGNNKQLQSGRISVTIGNAQFELTVHTVGHELLVDMPFAVSTSATPVAIEEWWNRQRMIIGGQP